LALFGDIISQFTSLISLENVFGGKGSTHSYPDTFDSINRADITNNPNYNDKSWQQSRNYAFLVVRANGNSVETVPDWKEFKLQINPQELSQDEIFAIEVTPTLRGVVVEHHGTVLKDIQISGTTGISPNRKEGGANKKTGNPLLTSGRSGFEEFHELRSYFRTYVEQKRTDQREGGELRMIFKNFKDQEFLYVEPQKFSMKRSASRPFLYDYVIQLKAIGNATDMNKSEVKTLAIDTLLSDVQDTLDTAVATIQGAIGIVTRIERSIINAVLTPLRLVSSALQAIAGGRQLLLGDHGITRSFVDQLNAEINRINRNFADAFGVNMSEFNAVSGRSSTLAASAGRKPTYQEQTIMNAMTKASGALLMLAAQKELFEKGATQTNRDINTIFGGKTSLGNPNSVRPAGILATDNIQTIAMRELGNIDAFKDIVILNNLKPPYLAPAGSTKVPGVLRPGDTILIPQNSSTANTGVKQNKIYNIQRNLNELERALGVDIRLNGDGDIAISNIGDASLIAGLDNIGQMLATKLLLELGSLKRHPEVGTSLGVGRKVTSNFLNDLQTQIVNSLSQDPRVESVPFIQLKQDGGTTTINMLVQVAKIQQPVPIPLTLQTG
jgi:hypothetical protein